MSFSSFYYECPPRCNYDGGAVTGMGNLQSSCSDWWQLMAGAGITEKHPPLLTVTTGSIPNHVSVALQKQRWTKNTHITLTDLYSIKTCFFFTDGEK